jgi:hypothetical protein
MQNATMMMRLCALAAMTAGTSLAAGVVPVVSNVTMTQDRSHQVIVEYDLANGPAVVTLNIETNGPSGWASIGLENVYANADSVTGDANRKVSAAHGRIVWRAAQAWPERIVKGNNARAVVTAWPVDDTPDYMVVDMTAGEPSADRVRYYVSTNSLPGGGLFGNNAYRTTHVGSVTDVQDLGNGLYAVTTVEGNMSNSIKSYCFLYDSNKTNHMVGTEKGLKLQWNMEELPKDMHTDPLVQYELHTDHWSVFGFCQTWK